MNRYFPLLLAVGLLIIFRVIGSLLPTSLPNFQPLAAFIFCGAMMARGLYGLAIPLAIWAVTYPLGQAHDGSVAVFMTTLLSFGLVFLIGKALAKRGLVALLTGSLAGAVLFHLVTNGAAWMLGSRYDHSVGGLWQSLWLGAPGDLIPSWVFLRNFAAANVLFTAVFYLGRCKLPKAAVQSPLARLSANG